MNKILKILFLIGVFFIPFNAFEGLSLLGEFRNESAVFFFLAGVSIMFFAGFFGYRVTIPFKNPFFQLILLFIIWCSITTVLNTSTVVDNYFKQTGGVNRFIRQLISLILSCLVLFLFYWNVIRRMSHRTILYAIRKTFFWSLLFASFYSSFEILIVYFNMRYLIRVLDLFTYFPFLDVKVFGDRISSISQESPYLAIYLMTIAGWMFSYILTAKGVKKFIPAFLVLVLTFFSGSRTGLVVISFQLLVFFSVLLFAKKYRKYVFIFAGSGIALLTIIVAVNSKKVIAEFEKKVESLDFKSNLTESVSNKSRIGIQFANFEVIKEHPIIGVGFGQQTYHNRFHYPVWSTFKNYEFRLFYKDQKLTSFPPGYNLYVRIMAETGIIGLLIFLLLLFLLLRQSLRIIKQADKEKKILGIILLVSFTGFSINWLQIDTFRLYGFWINLAILIYISRPLEIEEVPKITSEENREL